MLGSSTSTSTGERSRELVALDRRKLGVTGERLARELIDRKNITIFLPQLVYCSRSFIALADIARDGLDFFHFL